ncbi:MAG: molybdopterin-dependent oxidoreductase [Thermoplasmata archaeon]
MGPRQGLGAWIRGLPWGRFGAGLVAGAGALAVTYVLWLLGLGVFLPEVALDFVVDAIPGSIESFFIQTMGEGAKALGLVVALLLTLVVSGLFALPFPWLGTRLRRRWIAIAVFAFGYAAAVLLMALPLLGGGILGSGTAVGVGPSVFSQLIAGWIYAAVLDYFLVEVGARHPEGFRFSRRQFVAGVAAAVAVAALAFVGLGSLFGGRRRLTFGSVGEMVEKEVTPTGEFYVVTKNVADPVVDQASWRLVVEGLVATPRSYTYADLQARAQAVETITLECVSNEIGGDLISTARWEGVRLAALLEDADPDAKADWVAFTCADEYTVAIPRAKAEEATTLVALGMNGVALPPNHGFPARVVVPDLYGMFSAKWLTRISLVEGEFLGFWQRKGWTNQGEIRPKVIIATPRPDAVVTPPVALGGVAFAGTKGVSRVEVSTDGGASWSPATLRTPPLSQLTWVLWTFDWNPPAGGSFRILARLVDGEGRPQEPTPAAPFPNGASGYDAIVLNVAR